MSSRKPSKKVIYPDPNSWLNVFLLNFMKDFRNESYLSLWEALNEYVSFHSPHCAYKGRGFEGELFIYPSLSFDYETRVATLDRVFFVCKEANTILSHDYLSIYKPDSSSTPFFSFLRSKKPDINREFPYLEFLITQNNIEPSLAREILLKNSYNRRCMQRLFVFENDVKNVEYKSLNIVNVKFDLSFLEKSGFLNAKRYASFREFLPDDLMISIACKMDFVLPDVPKHLRQQQLLDVSSIAN